MKSRVRLIFLFFCSFLFFGVTYAQDQTNETMQRFTYEILKIKPYLLDHEKFLSSKNEAEISKSLENLKNLSLTASHKKILEKGDYKETLTLLTTHLANTEKYFNEGHKELARYMLQSTIHTCIACHSRLPVALPNLEKSRVLDSSRSGSYEEAEFLFATRNFSKALENFEFLVQKYPKNKLEITQLVNSLDYIAMIYGRILRDPQTAIKHFAKMIKRKNLPLFIQEDVEAWHQYFLAWSQEPVFFVGKHSDQEVIERTRNILEKTLNNPFFLRDRSNHITYLRASGILHEFLVTRPHSRLTPEAYYLLGVCYITLDHDFFIGFDQMYLKTCISKYSRHPAAKQCYHLLEESIYLGYTGSGGTHVPYGVMKELNHFKKIIYQ